MIRLRKQPARSISPDSKQGATENCLAELLYFSGGCRPLAIRLRRFCSSCLSSLSEISSLLLLPVQFQSRFCLGKRDILAIQDFGWLVECLLHFANKGQEILLAFTDAKPEWLLVHSRFLRLSLDRSPFVSSAGTDSMPISANVCAPGLGGNGFSEGPGFPAWD